MLWCRWIIDRVVKNYQADVATPNFKEIAINAGDDLYKSYRYRYMYKSLVYHDLMSRSTCTACNDLSVIHTSNQPEIKLKSTYHLSNKRMPSFFKLDTQLVARRCLQRPHLHNLIINHNKSFTLQSFCDIDHAHTIKSLQ